MQAGIKILILWCFAAAGSAWVSAQQTPLYSQYMLNKFLVNPAVAGGNSYTTVNLIAREQYLGFVNAPRTVALTGQTRLMNDSYIMRKLQVRKDASQASRIARVGLGGSIFSDRNGIISKTGLQLSYAYHINFDNSFQLSMGLTGSVFQFKLDDSEEYIVDPADPLLLGSRKQFWVPDATFGVFITNNKLYGGAAMTDLFGSKLKLGSSYFQDNFRTARNYTVMGGYRMPLATDFLLEPSFLLRANVYGLTGDINVRAFYMSDYWLGLSWRTDNSLITMAGVTIDMFYFGYAYDATLGTLRNYSSGSHELILGIRFGDTSTRRYRWIRKDETEFAM
jgi:type IX secretion system PorP/SprF family membrane protein